MIAEIKPCKDNKKKTGNAIFSVLPSGPCFQNTDVSGNNDPIFNFKNGNFVKFAAIKNLKK